MRNQTPKRRPSRKRRTNSPAYNHTKNKTPGNCGSQQLPGTVYCPISADRVSQMDTARTASRCRRRYRPMAPRVDRCGTEATRRGRLSTARQSQSQTARLSTAKRASREARTDRRPVHLALLLSSEDWQFASNQITRFARLSRIPLATDHVRAPAAATISRARRGTADRTVAFRSAKGAAGNSGRAAISQSGTDAPTGVHHLLDARGGKPALAQPG